MGVESIRQARVIAVCDGDCGAREEFVTEARDFLPEGWRMFDLDLTEEGSDARMQHERERSKSFVVDSRACYQKVLIELTDRAWNRESE